MIQVDREVRAAIAAVEKADSSQGLLDAVKALVALRHEASIPTLIDILRYNNPGAAVAAVDGLIELGEASVPYLLNNLDGYNYGARAWAIRAFAGIGDPSGLDLLLESASTDFSLSVRRAAAKGLGSMRWSKLSPEKILPAQQEALKTLLIVVKDGEWVVRYAAVVGLQELFQSTIETQADFQGQILQCLEDLLVNEPEIAVRARAKLACEIIGKVD
jgi:phycocyanobilin lyase beta subunit